MLIEDDQFRPWEGRIMNRTLGRKALVGVGSLVAASLLLATPAMAATFGGYITSCSSVQKVTAQGKKISTGGITLTAANRSFSDFSTTVGTITLRGDQQVGQWGVTGSGATSGKGYCS